MAMGGGEKRRRIQWPRRSRCYFSFYASSGSFTSFGMTEEESYARLA